MQQVLALQSTRKVRLNHFVEERTLGNDHKTVLKSIELAKGYKRPLRRYSKAAILLRNPFQLPLFVYSVYPVFPLSNIEIFKDSYLKTYPIGNQN